MLHGTRLGPLSQVLRLVLQQVSDHSEQALSPPWPQAPGWPSDRAHAQTPPWERKGSV